MLTSILRILVKNPIKENFYKKKKITINVLTVFFIFKKNDFKIFLKWILYQCLEGLVSIFQLLFMVDLNLCCTPDFHHCLGFQCVAADCHFMIILCISKEEFCPYFWCRVLILIDRQKFTICPETGMRLLMLLSKHHKQIILSIGYI